MNTYICSTPYHVLVSLVHILVQEEKSVIYLTTHDENSYKVFEKINEKLLKCNFIDKVFIRKRNIIMERLKIENIKDAVYYKRIKEYLQNGIMYIFPWNPYSLFTISNFLYNKAEKVILMEDGSTSYAWPMPSKLKFFLKKYVYGVKTDFYRDEKLERIFVQNPEKYPLWLQNKMMELNIVTLFNKLTKVQKEQIIKIFLSEKEIYELMNIDLKNTLIILTQPLSEDGFITENEKVNIYKNIVNKYSKEYKIVLKRHPREKMRYNFKNVLEIDGMFPSEIFTMLELKFDKAIGICTSAISLIDAKEKINIDENFLKKRTRRKISE